MVPFSDSIKELAAAARQLNQASDDLNAIIEDREDQIQQTGIGVSAWLDDAIDLSAWRMDDDGSAERADGWAIGFARVGPAGQWRIGAKRVLLVHRPDERGEMTTEYYDDDSTPIALLDAPRSVRLEALEKIDDLTKLLTKRARSFVESIERKKRAAK